MVSLQNSISEEDNQKLTTWHKIKKALGLLSGDEKEHPLGGKQPLKGGGWKQS